MGPGRRAASVRFRVRIDGQPPGAAHGIDVDAQGIRHSDRAAAVSADPAAEADRRSDSSRSSFSIPASRLSRSRSAEIGQISNRDATRKFLKSECMEAGWQREDGNAPMKAAQISKPGGSFRDRGTRIPQAGGRDKYASKYRPVESATATSFTKEGLWPGFSIPAFPDMKWWASSMPWEPASQSGRMGQRVGVGWHGGHDGTCRRLPARRFRQLPESCRFPASATRRVPGIHAGAGGGASAVRDPRRRSSAAAVRGHHDLQRAAPQRCAARRPCRRAGHRRSSVTLASVRKQVRLQSGRHRPWSRDGAARKEARRESLHRQPATNPAEELQSLGGATVILATAPSAKAMSALIDGLGPNGN